MDTNITYLKDKLLKDKLLSKFINKVEDIDKHTCSIYLARYTKTFKETDHVKCILFATEKHYGFICDDGYENLYYFSDNLDKLYTFLTEAISNMLSMMFE